MSPLYLDLREYLDLLRGLDCEPSESLHRAHGVDYLLPAKRMFETAIPGPIGFADSVPHKDE